MRITPELEFLTHYFKYTLVMAARFFVLHLVYKYTVSGKNSTDI